MTTGRWGTPLASVDRFDSEHLLRLEAVGVAAVEDLVSLAASDPVAVRGLLGEIDLDALRTDLLAHSSLPSTSDTDLNAVDYFFGAATPSGLAVPDVGPEDRVQHTILQLQKRPRAVERKLGEAPVVNLSEGMRPLRDQGRRHTCVAHASVALLEYDERARGADSTDLSPQYLYWLSKTRDGDPTGPGTLIKVAMEALVEEGVCAEPDWPYQPLPVEGNEAGAPPPAGASESAAKHKAPQVVHLESRSAAAMKEELQAGRPVAFSVAIYASSREVKVWTNPLGRIPLPISKNWIGNHAMCAVGYELDATVPGGGSFIVRNSWGTGWASASPLGAGYGLMPFGYVDVDGLEAFIVA